MGDGSKAAGTLDFLGFIISIESDAGDDSVFLRRRRPTNRSAAPMITTDRTYAATMDAICAGRYWVFLKAEACIGAPFPGGGAGPSKMLTCQMSAAAVVLVKKKMVHDSCVMSRRDGIVHLLWVCEQDHRSLYMDAEVEL